MKDWVTIASLATAAGTLALAGQRPPLVSSRRLE